jgi:small-conductance mechanosensitive channel
MFGKNKNYDEDIKRLTEISKEFEESIKDLKELYDYLEESVITLAKVQAQHRIIIRFFMNHATVNEDAQDDLTKMMQEVSKIENEFKDKERKNE